MSKVFKIGIAKNNNQKIEEVLSIDVLANKGIVGDRHFSEYNDPFNQLSLIESENIDHYNKKYNLKISYIDFRRNIITKGIKLNDLIDRKILIGDTLFTFLLQLAKHNTLYVNEEKEETKRLRDIENQLYIKTFY